MSLVRDRYSELPSSDTAKRICYFSLAENNPSLHTLNNDLSSGEQHTPGFLITYTHTGGLYEKTVRIHTHCVFHF